MSRPLAFGLRFPHLATFSTGALVAAAFLPLAQLAPAAAEGLRHGHWRHGSAAGRPGVMVQRADHTRLVAHVGHDRPRGRILSPFNAGTGYRWGGFTEVNQTIVIKQVERRPALGGMVSFADMPAVAGIRRTPVAPPTVYRIAGPKTAMHAADEARMSQLNPGARVITPEDVKLKPSLRRNYAVASRKSAIGPRIIVIRPQ